MKIVFRFILGIAVLQFLASCKKDEENTNPFGEGNGSYSFWNRSDLMVGNINIFVGGISAGTMSHYYPDGVSCGKADVNVVKKAGTYSWYATSSGGASWNGSINIEEGKCQLMELTGGGGGGGGGNGCNYSLNGIWTRQNDGACTGAAGLKVFFSGGQGSIQSTPSNSCGFVTGQVKWRNFNPSSCTIDDLNMPTGNYLSYSVSFSNQNTVKIGSITYTR